MASTDRTLEPYIYVSPAFADELGLYNRSAYSSLSALTLFDALDMIFIDGSATLVPWHPMLREVLILVKMAFDTGKAVFGTAVLAHMLAYLVSTGGHFVHVPDAGPGGALDALPSVAAHQTRFLDCDTGDLYERQPVAPGEAAAAAWRPSGHVGLRQYQAESRTRRRGRAHTSFVPGRTATASEGIGGRSLLANAVPHDPSVTFVRLAICARHRAHWLFAGVPGADFEAPLRRGWDLSLAPSVSAQVDVLANAPSTPAIVEYGHLLGVKCLVSARHPPTDLLLTNFVRTKAALMQRVSHLEFVSQSAYQRTLREGASLNFAQRASFRDEAARAARLTRSLSVRTRASHSQGSARSGRSAQSRATDAAGETLQQASRTDRESPGSKPQASMGGDAPYSDAASSASCDADDVHPTAACFGFVDVLGNASARAAAGRVGETVAPLIGASARAGREPSPLAIWRAVEERRALDGGGRACATFSSVCEGSLVTPDAVPRAAPTTRHVQRPQTARVGSARRVALESPISARTSAGVRVADEAQAMDANVAGARLPLLWERHGDPTPAPARVVCLPRVPHGVATRRSAAKHGSPRPGTSYRWPEGPL